MTIKQTEIINQYLNEYYGNDCRKLHKVVDMLLWRLKFFDVDKEDFYELSNEIIAKAIKTFDFKQDFDGYIYRCLGNKFKTEMTRRCRKKREGDKTALSLDSPLGNDEEKSTIGEMVEGKSTVESEFFGENEEVYSEEMTQYLSRLSPLQKEVLNLMSINFTPSEIIHELHIDKKIYEDCYKAIHSYRNIKVLF